jgi:exopolyphosphatase/guanosine-5'-triphosphate,3'-diphosphate pyrophosphatase
LYAGGIIAAMDNGGRGGGRPAAGAAGRVVALIDIGTNAARLMLVRVDPDWSYSVVSLRREPIRLGEHEFGDHVIRPEALDRAVVVCRSLAEFSRANGAVELVAVATSAARDAHNRLTLLHRLRDEAGLDVHVISGHEEARLIYLGVLGRLDLGARQALVIDIGGGSTEVIVGDAQGEIYLDSLNLGAIRLSDEFAAVAAGPVRGTDYEALQHRIRLASVHAVLAIVDQRVDVAYGTSGTIRSIGAVVARAQGREPQRDETMTRGEVKRAVKLLRSLPLAERRAVPGLSPERADIIVAGGAILETLMTELGVEEITALGECGLREGLLVDYLDRHGHGHLVRGLTVRERSVLALARTCRVDERHAFQVQRLAWELFDGMRDVGVHDYGDRERELLGFAAFLHDIGAFLSYGDHHLHTYYLIRNADLLGFSQDEIDMVAAIALFHRKALASGRHSGFAALEPAAKRAVRLLSVLLRLAERLDHSHSGAVGHVRVSTREADGLVLEIETVGDAQLEVWGMSSRRGAVEKVLGKRLVIETRETTPETPGRA